MGCVLCPAALGGCSVLQPPPRPQISPQSVPRPAHSSSLLAAQREQLRPHRYFQSFLMDMFFSLSFCITCGRGQGWVQH